MIQVAGSLCVRAHMQRAVLLYVDKVEPVGSSSKSIDPAWYMSHPELYLLVRFDLLQCAHAYLHRFNNVQL